jgi:F-box protein 18 (helicase)
MQLTDEQQAILASRGDIAINAVAGSGKTSTLIEYARVCKPGSRILYLAFNRSVKLEAQRRFADAGMPRIDIQTAHSLAYRQTVVPHGYEVANGYKTHDIVRILAIRPSGRDPLSASLLANHVLKLCALFCNSAAARVQDLDYLSGIIDEKAYEFVYHHFDSIVHECRRFLAMMDRKETPVTHDFYLKKFQLAKPRLPHDVLLFDEGQDASAVMLDVFLAQQGRKVIVGDVHQQIYGWRYAINALRNVEFPRYLLSTSFRFNSRIAGLAMECLAWKRHLGDEPGVVIKGVGKNTKVATRATIARTNLALLKAAIETAVRGHSIKKIYFEGNLNSYTYAADGASVYDVLNLYLGKKDRVRDQLIGSFKGFAELEEYAEKSEDQELNMLIDIVEEYGAELPALMKRIMEMHVGDDERTKADMVFSTVHRCKGMEYDSVSLAGDFITEERLKSLVANEKSEPIDRARVTEEVNLAYVAVTRSRNFLDFPDSMFPGTDKSLFAKATKKTRKPPTIVETRFLDKHRNEHARASMPWSIEQDEELLEAYRAGLSVGKIARLFERNTGAIRARLLKLGVEE